MYNRQPYEYPPWVPPTPEPSQPSRSTINSAATGSDLNVTVAAEGSPIGFMYGRVAVAPMIFAVAQRSSQLYVGMAWGMGEIDQVGGIYIGDELINPSYIVAQYTGTTNQPVDPTLAAIIPGYEDDLIADFLGEQFGIAYTVLRLPIDADFSFDIKAVIQGTKVYDPRTGLTEYSNNPALCLANFIESPVIGLGKKVNEASLIETANFNDELMSDSSKRHTVNVAFLTQSAVKSHVETLRAYANCWIFNEGDEVIFVPQQPRAVTGYIADEDTVEGTINISQISTIDQPTVVTLEYTDITEWPWTTAKESVKHPGVYDGTVPWRESSLSMQGIHNRSEAVRLATQRLNYATLTNLRAGLLTFDEALEIQGGDVVAVTNAWGLTGKAMRVISVDATGPGRWRLQFEEYDVDVYSNVVETDITWPDTGLPPPQDVPQVANLVVTEVLFQTDKGFWQSRLEVTWGSISDTYVFPHEYRVVIESLPGANNVAGPISETVTDTLTVSSPSVQEKVAYKVCVRAESRWGEQLFLGEYVVVNIQAQGKYLPPGDVPAINATEAGGEIFINWEPAVDIDIWRYELRYVTVGGTWENGVFVDRIDSIKLRTKDIPEGIWDLMIKAIDSVNNYSANDARTPLTVTYDPTSGTRAAYEYTGSSALVNMVPIGDNQWITSDGGTWDAAFPNVLDSYTNIVATYHGVISVSSWTSEEYSWGRVLDGTWQMPSFNAVLLEGGDPDKEMQLQDPTNTWYDFPSLVTKGGYDGSRAFASTTGGTLVVTVPSIRVEVSSSPKTESGQDYYDGVTPTTISLSYPVHTITSIQATPTGGTGSGRFCIVDNIIVGDNPSFDVLVFTDETTKVASDFYWEFRGI